ncbi:MAG: Nif3-like dinuclear metal center hexameric protein [Eggerthellaceae bacterium]|nr:Nif3-like dinuclear metal center hexameric protein [Eggerthellaceae bacterium]
MSQSDNEKAPDALRKIASGPLSKNDFGVSIGAIEFALLKLFPKKDAESWDRMGLLVGEPSTPLTKVAVALDPTVKAIKDAKRANANLLLTHHPAYLEPPDEFGPAPSVALNPGALVWQAITDGVALMNFHTALAVSPRSAKILPGMLGLTMKNRVIEPLAADPSKGYGEICEIPTGDRPQTLGQLAARCTSVFGRPPRAWGDFGRTITSVVTAPGSGGPTAKLALEGSIDCIICGEIRYHDALALSAAGLSIIEVGHDVSELPLVAVLIEALINIGIPEDRIVALDQSTNWSYPETIRL